MSDTENFKRPVVILAPHAGGDSIAYAWLLKRLKADGEAYFFEIAGHGRRLEEAYPKSYEEIVMDFVDFIRKKTEGDKNYIIAGDSMGAYLCDSAYGKIKAMGGKLPVHVIYGAVDPKLQINELSIKNIEKHNSNMDLLDRDNSYCRYLKDILEKDAELLRKSETWLSSILECEMSFFMGKNDSLLGDVRYDWSRLAPKGYREYLFDGEHLFMTSNKNVAETIIRIRSRYE